MIQCRICLEEYELPQQQEEDLISPCACTGGVKYVHRGCLDMWHKEPKTVYDRCTICNTNYEYEDTKTPSLSNGELGALVCLVVCAVGYFVPVFMWVHAMRQDENYIWYLNTKASSCTVWNIGMLIADCFVTMGLLMAILIYVLSLGYLGPMLTLWGKGDSYRVPRGALEGRSWNGSACYSVWCIVGVFVACGFIATGEELYFCYKARKRMNKKIKDLTFNKI